MASDKRYPVGVSPSDDDLEEVQARADRTGRTRIDPRDLGSIGHDDLGNAVWKWHPVVPGQRPEDPTIDMIECLDVDGMSIEDDPDGEKAASFDPYDGKR